MKELFRETEVKMKHAVDHFHQDLKSLRTGRASTSILESVMVDYYGTPTPIQQVANLTVADASMLVAQPWDPTQINAIEKGIRSADLGLNPSNDGKVVRIPVPPLTEERRKELVKKAHEMAEHARTSVRAARRDGNDRFEGDGEGQEGESGRGAQGPGRSAEAPRPLHRGHRQVAGKQREGHPGPLIGAGSRAVFSSGPRNPGPFRWRAWRIERHECAEPESHCVGTRGRRGTSLWRPGRQTVCRGGGTLAPLVDAVAADRGGSRGHRGRVARRSAAAWGRRALRPHPSGGGGPTRQDSVANCLAAAPGSDDDLLLVHDGARGAVDPADVRDTIAAVGEADGAVLGRDLSDTLKRIERGRIRGTVDREGLFRAETPQVFKRGVFSRALDLARRDGVLGTDEAALVERLPGAVVKAVLAKHPNPKLTAPADLPLFEALLRGRNSP